MMWFTTDPLILKKLSPFVSFTFSTKSGLFHFFHLNIFHLSLEFDKQFGTSFFFFTFLLPLMRAKNSSYAWSLVNCRLHQRLSLHDFRCTNSTLEFQYHSVCKNEPVILDVHFPCQCRSLLFFFFLILCLTFFDHFLKWWVISKISSFSSFLGESDNVFTLFVESSKIKLILVISPSYSSPSPIKAFEISTMYWSFCMLTFSFNLILRRGCER